MLRQYSVDGVIVASSTLPPGFAEAFRDAGVPVVTFLRPLHASSPYVHVVGIDNIACGRMAAPRRWSRRGYPAWPFSAARNRATSTQDRARGFFGELAEHPDFGATTQLRLRPIPSTQAGWRCKLLMNDPAQAYFCGDDVLSDRGAQRHIGEAG
jgi:DNA-binding LacI/PurR family transcriptional regulator